jgi:hypothetical protein
MRRLFLVPATVALAGSLFAQTPGASPDKSSLEVILPSPDLPRVSIALLRELRRRRGTIPSSQSRRRSRFQNMSIRRWT